MQYDDDDRPAKDWILRTDYGLDGDSLSYEDRCVLTILIISSFHFMAGWRGKSSRRKGELRRDNSWRRDGNNLVFAYRRSPKIIIYPRQGHVETEEGGGGRDPFQGHRGGEGVFPEKDVWPVLSVGYSGLKQVTFGILTDLVMVPRLTISERKGSQSISLTGNHIDIGLEDSCKNQFHPLRSQSSMNLDQLDQYMGGGGAGGMNR